METTEATRLLAALAQGTRLSIYRLLVQEGPEGLAAGALAERLGVANATLSFHLKELAYAGLISSRQEGRFIYYAPSYPTMNALLGFLTENCCQGTPCEITEAPAKSARTPKRKTA